MKPSLEKHLKPVQVGATTAMSVVPVDAFRYPDIQPTATCLAANSACHSVHVCAFRYPDMSCIVLDLAEEVLPSLLYSTETFYPNEGAKGS